jgi:hypothetical protein
MSSNIVGEGFENYVVGQITKRQEILGKPRKDSQDLIWENSRTGFVKLVSSANVRDLTKFGGGFTASSQLAERFVLFNGVTDEISTRLPSIETLQRGGIDPKGFATNAGAYGLGGTQWGFNPMPGITTANIKSEARGSLRTATISVKANNRDQFELINTLYLRLGYLMLLEWGHNCYYKNDDTFIDDTNVSLADPFITAAYSYNGFLEQIKLRRKETDGNYDALVGKVVNFNWTFNRDGSYDITIILRSIGDVIESLKSNILTPTVTVEAPTDNATAAANLASFLNRTTGANIPVPKLTGVGENTGFNAIDPYDEYGRVTSNSIIVAFSKAHAIGAKFAEVQFDFFTQYNKQPPNESNPNGMQSLPRSGDGKDYIVQEYDNKLTNMYIRFGTFLDLLTDLVIPTVKNGGKLVSFGDTSINNDRVLAYSPGLQISSDPRICTFKRVIGEYTISGEATDPFITRNKNNYIKLMNVYFNFVYVLKLLEDLKDKEGKISLVDLLNTMWEGYTKVTGNFNKITVRIDDENNEIIFVDETALPDREDLLINKNRAIFDVYGFTNSTTPVGGSFIRDMQLKTEITPQLATMITVGSTANGYVTGQDATTLSSLNRDTFPRISSDLISPTTPSIEPVDANIPTETKYREALTSYDNFVKILGSYKNGQSGKSLPFWNEDAFNNFTSTQTQLLEYEQQYQTNQARKTSNPYAASPNNGFLPFNLSLTMDGLSGMKIYQRYTINSTFLPKMYSNTVDFITKSINHTIQNNTWTTNIESIAIPKFPQPSPKTQEVKGAPANISPIATGTSLQHIPITNVGGLRNKIIEVAKRYVGIKETGGNDVSFNNADFQANMKNVGWTSRAPWCNFFTDLVWKEAYNEYYKQTNNANVLTAINVTLNKFIPGNPLSGNVNDTQKNMRNRNGKSYTLNFNINDPKTYPKPGDMIVTGVEKNGIIPTLGAHVFICTSVNPTNKTYTRIDGNYPSLVVNTNVPTSLGAGGENYILYVIRPPYADEDDAATTASIQRLASLIPFKLPS